jgi:signal transduction histidine kinase
MKSISLKLWVLMLALVFIALALIWCFQIVFLDSFYFNIHEKKLLSEGQKLAKMLQSNQSTYDIESKIDGLLYKYNARIDIYTTKGVVIYSSEAAPRLLLADKDAFLLEIIKANKAISAVKQVSSGDSILLVGIPVVNDNTLSAAVIMTVPIASLKETVDTLKEQFIIISLILISVSSILSYVFSKYFTKPILEITKAAKTMAEGNLTVKVPVYTKDELGVLASTINQLSVELQKIEQLRKELIANVSHEFKTPLSLIKGYGETIRDVKSLSEEKRDKQLSIIIEETDRLNNMINEILDLSQIQSENYKLDKSYFNLKQTLESVCNRLSYHGESKGLKLELDFAEDCIVFADEKRIEQVVYNLLINAINHSKEEGSIFIRLKNKHSSVLVEIEDQGEGISKEEIPYIWDRFYKAAGTASVQKGSGLGLSIVKSILEAHNTAYGVESELGKGSRFWFELQKAA